MFGILPTTILRKTFSQFSVVFSSSVVKIMSTNSTSSSTNKDQPSAAYEPGSASIAYVTTSDMNAAKELARGLIATELAACVNIVPGITSIYHWDGQLQEDNEVLMIIKTQTLQVAELCEYVRKNHSYEVAEVIAVPIAQGNPPYMDFLKNSMNRL